MQPIWPDLFQPLTQFFDAIDGSLFHVLIEFDFEATGRQIE
jgi:hypothetical protein